MTKNMIVICVQEIIHWNIIQRTKTVIVNIGAMDISVRIVNS